MESERERDEKKERESKRKWARSEGYRVRETRSRKYAPCHLSQRVWNIVSR